MDKRGELGSPIDARLFYSSVGGSLRFTFKCFPSFHFLSKSIAVIPEISKKSQL